MSYCFVIPNFNHVLVIENLLLELRGFNLPVIMVNDGSDHDVKQQFEKLDSKYDFLTLVNHQINQGKGGAMQTALALAHDLGFSHAIQVDADGQHDLTDIKKIIKLSQNSPSALISGMPIYDESVPKHRFYSRYITHVWVWIETLSLSLKDSMCGFRVYPLKDTSVLMNKVALGKRMDFDTEVMVRLYWANVPVEFFKTKVNYPENGISHFQPFKDNVLISWMHTRLFFGMLLRSPKLIFRKFKN